MKNLKTDKSTVAAAVAASIPMVTAFNTLDGYSGFNSRVDFAAWTNAALVTASYVTFTAKGTPTKARTKSQPALLRALLGSTAWAYWHKKGRLESSAKKSEITVDGLNEIQARLSGNSKGYNTDMESVKKLVVAQSKGGTVKLGKSTYKIDSEVSVKKA